MRIRKITGVAAGLSAILVMAGCSGGQGGPTGDAAGDQKVTLWMYPVMADEAAHKKHWDGVIADFEKKNPDITVDYEIFPWQNRDEALQTAVAARTAPDLVYLIPDQLAAYQKSIEPMGPHLSDDRKDDLLPNVIESVTLDGEMLGAPLLTTANSLICNASAFEAAGVEDYPETWDDVMEMAPKFTEKGMYAISYAANPEMTLNMSFYPLLWQAGGSIYGDEGASVAFDGSEGVEALSFLADLHEQGALEPDVLTTAAPLEQTALAQGKVGCTWSRAVADILPLWAPEEVVVLPPLAEKEAVSYGTVGSLAMLKGAGDKEAAAAFAEYASGADVLVPYLKASGFFSPLSSTGEIYADDPILSAVEANIATTTVGELYPSARALQGALIPEIQAAILGDKTPKQALKDAAAAAQPLLAG